MGYLWPPSWWPLTSLSPEPVDEEKERERADYIAGFFSVPAGQPEREPTEEEMVEAEAAFERWWAERDTPCDNCGRPNFMGQELLEVGNKRRVCIDCFSFVTGSDPRDPAVERSARSGDPAHLTLAEWRAVGEPSVPVRLSDTAADLHVEESGPLPGERPLLAPLPPGTPRWVRFLHWLGVEMVSKR